VGSDSDHEIPTNFISSTNELNQPIDLPLKQHNTNTMNDISFNLDQLDLTPIKSSSGKHHLDYHRGIYICI
jgi:hypothetical protein